MSKLEELIHELCPDGVKYKTLGEMCFFRRGTSFTSKQAKKGNVPVISGGKKPAFFHNVSNRKPKSITIAGSGAYAGYVQWWETEIFCADSFTLESQNESELNNKYLFYFLTSIQNKIYSQQKGTSIPHVHSKDIENFKIPVPPLEVQEKIVRILDTFAELTNELTNELTARKKQYEYYRDQLLTFDNSIEKKPLGEIAHIFRGEYITKNSTHIGNIPVILGGQEPAYYIDKFNHTGEVTVISRSGASAGFVSYWNEPIFITDGFGYEAKNKIINQKYLYFILKNMEFSLNKMKRGAGIPHISGESLKQIKIPIPSLEEQERIVAILDSFDSLCNGLTSGLPAEIEARQKQYEYYRDKLLSFKELKEE